MRHSLDRGCGDTRMRRIAFKEGWLAANLVIMVFGWHPYKPSGHGNKFIKDGEDFINIFLLISVLVLVLLSFFGDDNWCKGVLYELSLIHI